MSKDLSEFKVVSEPHIGGNHSSPELSTGHEKNWTWFGKTGSPHCLYSLHPLEIHAFNPDPIAAETTSPRELPWIYGTLRGGTNPELHDGQYWMFFHSSLPWKDATGTVLFGRDRRYYMGAVTMTAEPPFRLTSITPTPLLRGSEEDPRTVLGPPVVFPCGAKLIDGSWLVTMGINDERCGWISIPHEELKAKMVPIE